MTFWGKTPCKNVSDSQPKQGNLLYGDNFTKPIFTTQKIGWRSAGKKLSLIFQHATFTEIILRFLHMIHKS
jgi:hypothetical protein